MALPHTGSWGLPDFGITEKLSDLFGGSRTSQGGSNLLGTSKQAYNPSGGQVLGTSSELNYTPAPSNFTSSYSPTSSTGTSSGGTSPSASIPATLSQPQPQSDPYSGILSAEEEAARAELASLNTEFDRNRSLLEGQLGNLSTSRENALSNFNNQKQNLLSQISGQKADAYSERDKNIDSAAQAARNTQSSNRNMLRALGILNSTAAGDILSRPLNEFDRTKAEYVQLAQKRTGELDDYLNAKTSELTLAVKELEDNYANLMGQIQTDLRFSDRERADAVRSANAALSQRMSEIKMAQVNHQNEVNAQKQNIALELAKLGDYNMPGYDINQMQSTQFNPQTESYKPAQVGVYEDEKKRLSDLN